jgi:hypothetical protein
LEEIADPSPPCRAVLYRWQQAIPSNMDVVKNLLVFISFAYTVLVLNYSAVGFMVSSSYWKKSF